MAMPLTMLDCPRGSDQMVVDPIDNFEGDQQLNESNQVSFICVFLFFLGERGEVC